MDTLKFLKCNGLKILIVSVWAISIWGMLSSPAIEADCEPEAAEIREDRMLTLSFLTIWSSAFVLLGLTICKMLLKRVFVSLARRIYKQRALAVASSLICSTIISVVFLSWPMMWLDDALFLFAIWISFAVALLYPRSWARYTLLNLRGLYTQCVSLASCVVGLIIGYIVMLAVGDWNGVKDVSRVLYSEFILYAIMYGAVCLLYGLLYLGKTVWVKIFKAFPLKRFFAKMEVYEEC